MRVSERLQQVGIVLKDTTHPGNIGSAARAIKTMGLSRLLLAAAQTRIDNTARARSAGAEDILEAARFFPALRPALNDFTHVYAFSARRRDLSPRRLTPRQAAEEAMQLITSGGSAAFVFGGEQSGLTNEDIRLANAVVEIPAAPDYASLNLGQAVQIACYELRLAAGAVTADSPRTLPTQESFNAMIDHLQRALVAIDLPRENDTRPLLPRLRRLLTKADLDDSEVRLLRGVWRAIIRASDNSAVCVSDKT